MTKATINVIYFSILFVIFALVDFLQGREIMWITNTIAVFVTALAIYFLDNWRNRREERERR